jgi:hypothetical protein
MEDHLSFYKNYIEGLRQRSGNQYTGNCPFGENHSDGKDSKPSFEVNIETGQYCCLSCNEKGNKHTFCKKLGITSPKKSTMGKIESIFPYTDEKGGTIFEVVRYEGKIFKQRRPNGNGGYIGKTKGLKQVPYKLPELLKSDIEQWVLIPEGEKKVNKLYEIGFTATCNAMGAGKWRENFNPYFKNRKVCILPDNDLPGKKHGENIAENLYPIVKEIRVLNLPGLSEKGDIINWVEAEYQKGLDIQKIKDKLINLVNEAEVWTPNKEKESDDTVIIKAGRLPFIIDKVEEIFLKKNPHSIFQRNGQVVKIATLDQKKDIQGIKREAGAVIISPIDDDHYITDLFGRNMNFLKKNKNDETYPVDPPQKIGKTYLSRIGEWKLSVLTRIIECPALRSDGSILDEPGYDEKTGLYFCQGKTAFEKINPNVNKDDAYQALEILKKPIKDFPFVTDSDRSVAIAAVLTAITRQSLRSAPLFGFTAPTMGSGKSLLAEIISLIATGRLPAMMPQSKDPDEDRKKILSFLMAGDPLILIDNCEKPISGGSLCSILTQEYYQDRILSVNKMARVNTAVTIIATGNNLQFMGDMTTRALLCTIDPGMEKPEERQFDINIYELISKNRALYVNAALSILKAFWNAKKPKQDIKPYGRFEQWSDLIRSALVWLGQDDPCNTRLKIDANDPVQEQLKNLLSTWWGCFENIPMTIRDTLIECNNKMNDTNLFKNLFDAIDDIANDKGSISQRKLGWFLKKYKGRIAENSRFIESDLKYGGRTKWQVVKK